MLASVASVYRDLQNFLISGTSSSSLLLYIPSSLILVDLFLESRQNSGMPICHSKMGTTVCSKQALSATALPALPAGHSSSIIIMAFTCNNVRSRYVRRDGGASYRIYCGMRSIYRPVTSGGNFIVTKFTLLSDVSCCITVKEN